MVPLLHMHNQTRSVPSAALCCSRLPLANSFLFFPSPFDAHRRGVKENEEEGLQGPTETGIVNISTLQSQSVKAGGVFEHAFRNSQT